MAQVNARIDKEIYDQLSEYSEITGVPVSRCIAEAAGDWLQCVVPFRLAVLVDAINHKPSDIRLTESERKLLAVVEDQSSLLGREIKKSLAFRGHADDRLDADAVAMPSTD